MSTSVGMIIPYIMALWKIRRPRPLPRQGRRLGPPEVWNFAFGSQAQAHAIKATPLSATCPSHLHAPAVCPASNPPKASNPPNSPQASKATTLTATCRHLFFRGFRQQLLQLYMPLPSVFQGVQDCRLPALKPPKPFQRFRRPPRQQLLERHVPAICFSGGSRLPFARPQTPQTLPTLPQASASNPPNASAGLQGNNSYSYMSLPSVFQGVQDCRLPALKPPKRFQRSRRRPRQQLLQLYMSLPSVFQDVQDCRLPGLKPSKRFRRPPRQQLLQLLHAPAICFSGGSRLPFARPQTPQTLPTLPQASKATTLTATTCTCHLFFRGFKTAVCPPSNPPNPSNASAGLQGNNSYSYYMPLPSVFQGVQDCRLPALKPPKPFQRFRRPPRQQLLQLLHAPAICFSGGSGNNSYSYTCPCHLFFRGFKTAVCPPSNPPNPSNASAGLQGNNSYSYYMPLPSVFSGGSRLPFARPQTPQTLPTLPRASKATTLRATCPCHLFFRGFKTAVCPPSNPPNASNAPAGLQGNNS